MTDPLVDSEVDEDEEEEEGLLLSFSKPSREAKSCYGSAMGGVGAPPAAEANITSAPITVHLLWATSGLITAGPPEGWALLPGSAGSQLRL